MGHFNDTKNAGFYATTTFGEFYMHPFEISVPGMGGS